MSNLVRKWATALNRHFSKEVHEMMLNVTNHRGYTNEKHSEIHLMTIWMATIKKPENKSW